MGTRLPSTQEKLNCVKSVNNKDYKTLFVTRLSMCINICLHLHWSWPVSPCQGCSCWSVPWGHLKWEKVQKPLLRQQLPRRQSPPQDSGTPPSHTLPLWDRQLQQPCWFLLKQNRNGLLRMWNMIFLPDNKVDILIMEKISKKGLTVIIIIVITIVRVLQALLFSLGLLGFAAWHPLKQDKVTKVRKCGERSTSLNVWLTAMQTSCSICPSAEACKDVWTSTGPASNSSISSSSFSSSPLP